MTVSGHIGIDAEFIPSLEISQEIELTIDFNDPRAAERVEMLRYLCTRLEAHLGGFIDIGEEYDYPRDVTVSVSPAFEGGFTREQMDRVEETWDSDYDTTLSIRFDGTVDEVAREAAEVEDLHALDEWRGEHR